MTWQSRSACLGLPGDMFFPESNGHATEALAVCEQCLVRSECLEHAIATNEHDGVRGGLTAADRRRLIRRRVNHQQRRDVAAAAIDRRVLELLADGPMRRADIAAQLRMTDVRHVMARLAAAGQIVSLPSGNTSRWALTHHQKETA